MTDDVAQELLDTIDAVLQLLQLLVLELSRQGHLDAAAYARTLTAWRNDQVQPGSAGDVLVHRMLDPLVTEPSVLIRRSGFRLVEPDTPDDAPTSPMRSPDPEDR